ncbi:hypothetical protein [Nocardia gamkensis]|uniref:hypothetical protein n=1 Tax=Nocardia gamkensis TaxID=352869 RepID=UPI0036E6DE30
MERLADLAKLDAAQLAACTSPAMRAALDRHFNGSKAEGDTAWGFQSFIDLGE